MARRSRSVGWRASERVGAGAGRGEAPAPRGRGVPPGIPEGSQQRCREERRWAAPGLSTADGPHCGLGSRADRCFAWLPSTLLRASSRGGAPAMSLRWTSRTVKLRCARPRELGCIPRHRRPGDPPRQQTRPALRHSPTARLTLGMVSGSLPPELPGTAPRAGRTRRHEGLHSQPRMELPPSTLAG